MKTEPLYGMLIEVEGKDLQSDVLESLNLLKKYDQAPEVCWVHISVPAQILHDIPLVPHKQILSTKNLMFMYQMDPRKDVNN